MPETMAPNIGMLPQPQLLPGIFLDVADLLDLGSAAERWMIAGVKFTPRTVETPLQAAGIGDCAGGVPLEPVARPLCLPAVSQNPFTLVDLVEMKALELMAFGGEEDVDGEALDRFRHLVSAAFASELISGTASGGISLSNSATAPAGLAFGTASKLTGALALLEAELATRLLNSRGVIHLPPVLLSQAIEGYSLTFVDGHWTTPLGNIVIVDAGYAAAPQPTGGGDAAGATEVWVYASGPVHYRLIDGKLNARDTSSFAFATNDITRWTQGYGLIVFEPSLVTAAQVLQVPA